MKTFKELNEPVRLLTLDMFETRLEDLKALPNQFSDSYDKHKVAEAIKFLQTKLKEVR